MAGAGYKLFGAGDILTAGQVNTYLNEQSVMVFATTAARDSSLSSVLAEGMTCYVKDMTGNGTAGKCLYTGSEWRWVWSEWEAFTPDWGSTAVTFNDDWVFMMVPGGALVTGKSFVTSVSATLQLSLDTTGISFIGSLRTSYLGNAFFYDASAGDRYHAVGQAQGLGKMRFVFNTDSAIAGLAGVSLPFVWAAGDEINYSGTVLTA